MRFVLIASLVLSMLGVAAADDTVKTPAPTITDSSANKATTPTTNADTKSAESKTTAGKTTEKHTAKKPVIGEVPAKPKFTILAIEHNIIAKTNAERTRNGLAPLVLDESLMRSARSHCLWMARNQSMQHTSGAVAENIAMGQSSSTEAVQDWMNSPGHRANILSGSYTRIGVAAYRARSGQVYWCQQFLQ